MQSDRSHPAGSSLRSGWVIGGRIVAQKEAAGRMTFVLFTDKAPRAAENYRLLFSGEKV